MSNKILKTKILLLNGSSQEWVSKASTVLKKGEPGVEFVSNINSTPEDNTYTKLIIKVGDGTTPWNKLPEISTMKLDNGSINFNDNGLVQIAGFEDASIGYIPRKTAVKDNNDIVTGYTTEWVSINSVVSGVVGDSKSVDTDDGTNGEVTVKIHNFDDATEGQVPHKVNGEVVWKNVVTTDSKTVVESGDGIDVSSVATGDTTTYTVKHEDTSNVESVTAADRTYVKSLTFDDFGHVTGVETGTETVENTNTAHTHTNGKGTTSSGGGAEGTVSVDLNIDLKLENNIIKIVDKDKPTEDPIAELDANQFIKDSMISKVELVDTNDKDETGKFIKITWKTDKNQDGDTEDNEDLLDVTYIDVSDLVDAYTGGTYITVNTDNTINHNSTTRTNGISTGETLEHSGKFTVVDEIESNETGHITGVKTKEYTLPSMEHNHDDKYAPIGIDVGVVDIISNDTKGTDVTTDDDATTSGIKITRDYNNQDGVYNIEIDDSITFILNGGTVTDLPE